MSGGLNQYLLDAVAAGASDLHVSFGRPPMVRVNGKIAPLDHPPFTPTTARETVYEVLDAEQRRAFEEHWELDFAYTPAGVGRFRVNAYFQKGCVGAAFRVVPQEVSGFEELGLPGILEDLANKPRGLILVTGPTGSGKSTTLAAMIDKINSERNEHIMSVEDPIEFLHEHKRCLVNQREVNQDTKSMAHALKHVLRQDPDVILVGEMRDLETISLAVTAAETGHLVLGTLHTRDAPQTVDRIIDVFPAHQQSQIRAQLANVLQGVVTQTLIPRRDGGDRAVACEVLVPTSGIRNLIREGKSHQIYSSMQTGGKYGMQTLNAALVELVRSETITFEEAEKRSDDPDELRRLAGGSRELDYDAAAYGDDSAAVPSRRG